MRRLLLQLIAVVCLAAPSFANVTFTANLKQMNQAAADPAASQVVLTLRNCKGIARVISTGELADLTQPFTPDATGLVSQTMWANNEIDCSGATSSYYNVQIVTNGESKTWGSIQTFAGSAADLKSMTTCGIGGSVSCILQATPAGPIQAANISMGTTTTLGAGSSATVTNSGSATSPILNFGIPAGPSGTAQIQSYASLPAPGNPGSLARLTTGAKGVYRDFGNAWGAWQPSVDVRDYGALCDGATDDTTGLQAAYSSMNAIGGTLLVPGQCNFTALDVGTVHTRKVTFRGSDGMGVGESIIPTSILMCTRSDSTRCIDARNNDRGLTFKDLGIGFNNASYSGHLLDCGINVAANCAYMSLDNVTVGGFGAAQATRGGAGMVAVELDGSIFANFHSVHFTYSRVCLEGSTGANGSNGVYVDGMSTFTKCGLGDGTGAAVQNAGQAWTMLAHCDGTAGMGPCYRDTLTRGPNGFFWGNGWMGDVVNANNSEMWFAPAKGVTITGLQSSTLVPIRLLDQNADFAGLNIFGNAFTAGILDLGNFTQAIGSAITVGSNYIGRNGETGVSQITNGVYIAVNGLVRSGNVVTVTTTSAHGVQAAVNTPVPIAITGSLSGTFDGIFEVTSVPSTTTLTYAQTGGNETSGQGILSQSNSGIMHENVRKFEVNISPQGFGAGLPIGTLGHPASPIWGQTNMPGPVTFGTPVQDTTRSLTVVGGAPAIKKIDLTGRPSPIPRWCSSNNPPVCNTTPSGATTHTYTFYFKDKFGKRALTPATITRSDFAANMATNPAQFFFWCGTNGRPGTSWTTSGAAAVVDVDALRDGLLIGHLQLDPASNTCAIVQDNGQTGAAYVVPTHEESADFSADGNIAANNINPVLAGNNSLTLVDRQGPAGAITGNSTDLTVFTTSVAGNTIAAGKCLRATVFTSHSTGAGNVTYKWKLGSTVLATDTQSASSYQSTVMICNLAGVQNSQFFFTQVMTGTTAYSQTAMTGTAAENTANTLALSFLFNAANTEQETPKFYLSELIQ